MRAARTCCASVPGVGAPQQCCSHIPSSDGASATKAIALQSGKHSMNGESAAASGSSGRDAGNPCHEPDLSRSARSQNGEAIVSETYSITKVPQGDSGPTTRATPSPITLSKVQLGVRQPHYSPTSYHGRIPHTSVSVQGNNTQRYCHAHLGCVPRTSSRPAVRPEREYS